MGQIEAAVPTLLRQVPGVRGSHYRYTRTGTWENGLHRSSPDLQKDLKQAARMKEPEQDLTRWYAP